MTDSQTKISQGAYIAYQSDAVVTPPYRLILIGQKELYKSVKPGEWVLVINKALQAISVGRVYCQRSTLVHTTVFFDKHFTADAPTLLSVAELSPPKTGQVSRLEWVGFTEALPKLFHKTIAEIPLIEDDVYVRDLFQYAVMDDLLGPANGPFEQILDMSVRDRYLVGRLAPLDSNDKSGGLGVDGSSDDEDEPEAEPLTEQSMGNNAQMPGLLPPEGIQLKEYMAEIEISLISQALEYHDYVVARAAEILGVRRTTLVEKMRKYNLNRD